MDRAYLKAVSRQIFLLMSLLVSGTGLSSLEARPNVVFILTDDQGHWAINADGRDDCTSLKTPSLDRLVRSLLGSHGRHP